VANETAKLVKDVILFVNAEIRENESRNNRKFQLSGSV